MNIELIDADGDCVICFSKKERPMFIDCGHVFCRNCIKGHYTTQRKNQGRKEDELGPDCPVCRNPITLTRFYRAEALLSSEAGSSKQLRADTPARVIVEENEPGRHIKDIIGHYGRGRNIKYCAEFVDGTFDLLPKSALEDTEILRDYSKRIRANNQARYRAKMKFIRLQ